MVGCAVTKKIEKGFRLINNSKSEERTYNPNEPKSCICGISRIWVSKYHRRKGIAFKLLEAVRKHFVYGIEMKRDEDMAFSQPTDNGNHLATKYFGRNDYLIFDE